MEPACPRPASSASQNFWRILEDPVFWISFKNTFLYLIVGTPLSLVLSFLVAYYLDQVRFGHGLIRAFYFIPHLTTAVAMAWVWRWFYQPPPIGVFNNILNVVGLRAAAVPELDRAGAPRRAGAGDLGRARIPDRALPRGPAGDSVELLRGRAHRRRWEVDDPREITLPLLRPTIVFLVVISSIGFLRIFDNVYNMTDNGAGGPLNSTKPLVLKIYETAFGSYRMGYAAAQTVVLFVDPPAISLVQLRLIRSRS